MFKAALAVCALAICCFAAERTFYGYVDESGFLHESLFLPLGFILSAIALVLLIVAAIQRLLRKRPIL